MLTISKVSGIPMMTLAAVDLLDWAGFNEGEPPFEILKRFVPAAEQTPYRAAPPSEAEQQFIDQWHDEILPFLISTLLMPVIPFPVVLSVGGQHNPGQAVQIGNLSKEHDTWDDDRARIALEPYQVQVPLETVENFVQFRVPPTDSLVNEALLLGLADLRTGPDAVRAQVDAAVRADQANPTGQALGRLAADYETAWLRQSYPLTARSIRHVGVEQGAFAEQPVTG